MKSLALILSLFRAECQAEGIAFPDSVQIEYAVLGLDTLGVTHKRGAYWLIQISRDVDPDILETVVWHELGHVAGLDHCRGRSIMNYNSMTPLTKRLKRLFLNQLRKLARPSAGLFSFFEIAI